MLAKSTLGTPGVEIPNTMRPGSVWKTPDVLSRGHWEISADRGLIEEFLSVYREDVFHSATGCAPILPRERTPKLVNFSLCLRDELLFGDGFVRVKRTDRPSMSPPEERAFFLRIGMLMGRVMTEYGQLYPVCDRGIDYKQEAAPVSMTTAETGMHTDSSAIGALPDFVGLLCEEPSASGGASLISNALTIYHDLCRSNPDTIGLLEEKFIRDVVTPGASRSIENLLGNSFPIFSRGRHGRGSTFRYMRYWIEKGAERAGAPLQPRQIEALNRLDEELGSPENQVTLSLDRGDILFVNNRTLAHGRTGYSDRPGNRRQLQRIWVDATH